MAKGLDVFKRKEVKYLLTDKQYRALLDSFDGVMRLDDFGKTIITSVYYDTEDWALIERSLDKPLYKEKLRVRVYGTTTPRVTDEAFIEIKTKFKGIVYKRRVACTYGQAQTFLEQTSLLGRAPKALIQDIAQEDAHRLQVLREIEAFIARHGALYPSMAISCSRLAFTSCVEQDEAEKTCEQGGQAEQAARAAQVEQAAQTSRMAQAAHRADCAASVMPVLATLSEASLVPTANSEEVRITFDSSVAWRDARAAKHAWPNALLEQGERIMEVKVPSAYPLWLAHALGDLAIYPSSFSKYGTAYKARMNMIERSCCA